MNEELIKIFEPELSADETIYWVGSNPKQRKKEQREGLLLLFLFSAICITIGITLYYIKDQNEASFICFTAGMISLILVIYGLFFSKTYEDKFAITNKRVLISNYRHTLVKMYGRKKYNYKFVYNMDSLYL